MAALDFRSSVAQARWPTGSPTWRPKIRLNSLKGEVPIVSTMVDAAGNPIAWLFTQRRWVVPGDRIADTMKLAIVSIEDKRFG